MSKFYFTYGTDGHPYYGGWSEVIAPNIHAACDLFRAFHPDRTPGILNCSDVYTEEEFESDRSGMFKSGNFGAYCHEVLCINREVSADG